MADAEALIAEERKKPVWQAQTNLHTRATSIVTSRVVRVAITAVAAAMLLAAVVLVGVMVHRQDPDVSAAVRHLFVRVDSERLPVLPADYPGTSRSRRVPPDTLLIVGDAWAGGLGVTSTADDAWWAQLRARHLPDVTVVRSINASARMGDLAAQLSAQTLPASLQGRRVALIVQLGWNDVIADTAGVFDYRAAIGALGQTLVDSIKAAPFLQRAISVSVYVLDYPDASAGTGFTRMQCAPPLDRVYNHPAAAAVHLRALDMLSAGLLAEAHSRGFAFVPVRQTLATVGASGALRASANAVHALPADVAGTRLPSPPPPGFDRYCDTMSAAGQGYQADLLAAYLLNTAYFTVG